LDGTNKCILIGISLIITSQNYQNFANEEEDNGNNQVTQITKQDQQQDQKIIKQIWYKSKIFYGVCGYGIYFAVALVLTWFFGPEYDKLAWYKPCLIGKEIKAGNRLMSLVFPNWAIQTQLKADK
jgi:hypothetical protein